MPASPQLVILYLITHAKTLAISTLERRLLGIAREHRAAGLPAPTTHDSVKNTMANIRRERGTAQEGKAALLLDDLKLCITALPEGLLGVRDRALLLLGWAAALRRSELAGLDVNDLVEHRQGIVVTIRRSKTDQEGKGHRIAVPRGQDSQFCPVSAVSMWKEAARIDEGALFRRIDRHGNVGERITGEAVSIVVKRAVERIGLASTSFGGHSLRAGLVTSARIGGAEVEEIMKTTRHTSERTLRQYIRDADLFRGNAATTAGL